MNANEFAKSGQHLPRCLRDFHDAKDVFKSIGGMSGRHSEAESVSWVDGHCYVIDKFLHFMAQHGYTLQRSRRPIPFYDLNDTIEERKRGEADAMRAMFAAADAERAALTKPSEPPAAGRASEG